MATAAVTKSKSTELSPVAQSVKALVTTKRNLTLAEVLRRAQTAAEIVQRRTGELVASTHERLPVPTGNLTLTAAQQAAVEKFVNVAANAPALPTSPRELEDPELDGIVRFFLAAKELESVLSGQIKGVRGAVLNHLTLRGERQGKVTDETARDKTGWALVNEKLGVEGEAEQLSVESRSGEASITAEELEAMEAEGVISHREMLEATKHVRQIDESGFFTLLRRKPELADYLAARATYKASSISLYKRK